MEQNLWKITDETLDQIAEEFDQLLDSPAVTEIKKLLCDLDIKLGTEFTVSLSCIVDVCDENTDRREHALRLLTTGLSFSENGEVYRTSGDSSPQRYVVDGDIQVVPNDQCPKCCGSGISNGCIGRARIATLCSEETAEYYSTPTFAHTVRRARFRHRSRTARNAGLKLTRHPSYGAR